MPTITQESQETASLTPSYPSHHSPSYHDPAKADRIIQYRFQQGNKLGGRTLGSKNRLSASDILKRRETRIAKRYVQRAEQSDTVLIDAMKHLLPKESAGSSAPQLIIFMGNNDLLPRSIPPQDIVSSLPDNFSDPRRIAVSEAASVENA